MRPHSRGSIFARVLHLVVPLSDRGRRESRALTAPAASYAKVGEHTSVVTTGSAGTTRLSPRNGFNDCFVLSPVKRPLLPPSLHGTYHTA
jgi:hypothetical protein